MVSIIFISLISGYLDCGLCYVKCIHCTICDNNKVCAEFNYLFNKINLRFFRREKGAIYNEYNQIVFNYLF